MIAAPAQVQRSELSPKTIQPSAAANGRRVKSSGWMIRASAVATARVIANCATVAVTPTQQSQSRSSHVGVTHSGIAGTADSGIRIRLPQATTVVALSVRDSTRTVLLTDANSSAAPTAASVPAPTSISPGRMITMAPANPASTASQFLSRVGSPSSSAAPAMVNSGVRNWSA